MSGTKFLIAKYVPVVRRMEPRNIGVVAWDGTAAISRFIGSKQAADDARAPTFIRTAKKRESYCEWVAYWRLVIGQESINTGRGFVSKSADGYLEALKAKSRDNFMLVDGGEILSNEESASLSDICEYLFAELVTDSEDGLLAPPLSLKVRSDLAVKTALADRDVKRNASFSCDVKAVPHTFQWNYGVYDGDRPLALFQRADVSSASSCNSAAFMLENAVSKSISAAALVTSAPEGSRESSNIKMLNAYGPVVFVDDPQAAVPRIRQLAGV